MLLVATAVAVGAVAVPALADNPPTVGVDDVSSITEESAEFFGTVNPEGGPSDTTWRFEISTDESSWNPVGPFRNAGNGSSNVAVEDDVNGLEPATDYFVRLVASNEGGVNETATSSTSFRTEGPPDVSLLETSPLGAQTARLRAAIGANSTENSLNADTLTECYFEYGLTEALGERHGCTSQGTDGEVNLRPVNSHPSGNLTIVDVDLADLTPETTYHFRVRATNIDGHETVTKTKNFETLAAQVRPPLGRGFLPHGRVWEMVSPPAKSGGAVMVDSSRVNAAADGNAFQFASMVFFGDDVLGGGKTSEYISLREDDSWTTKAIGQPQEASNLQEAAINLAPFHEVFSEDLNFGLYQAISPLDPADGDPDDPRRYMYRVSDLRQAPDQSYEHVTPTDEALDPFTSGLSKDLFVGSTASFDTILFASNQNLTGQGTGTYFPYLYRNGDLELINQIPAGSDGTCGANGPACTTPGSFGSFPGGHPGVNEGTYSPRTLSTDGERVIFAAPTNSDGALRTGFPVSSRSKLFVRDNQGTADPSDDVTTRVNSSELPAPAQQHWARFEGASTDGTRVFFRSQERLTESAPASGVHLYVWDEEPNDETQQLTIDATGGTFTLSFDGQTTDPLAFDADAGAVADALNDLSSIGGADASVEVSGGPSGGNGATPYLITFNGSLSEADVPAMSADSSSLSGGAAAAVVSGWTLGGGHLRLVNVDRDLSDGHGNFNSPNFTSGSTVYAVSEDGKRLFFTMPNKLVPGQSEAPTNQHYRLYVWDNGEIHDSGFSLPVTDNSVNRYQDNLRRSPGLFGATRLTSDGARLLFTARTSDGLVGPELQGRLGYYLYDVETGSLTCVSCRASAAPATVDAHIDSAYNPGVSNAGISRPRGLSEDGSLVFFTTGEQLVPEDINGQEDAYAFDVDTGLHHLISSGTSGDPSFFLDASADGKDVFFATTEPLSAWDTDDDFDVYDARVGGGLPEPASEAEACRGNEECRGRPGIAPPADDLAGSATDSSEGNVSQPAGTANSCTKKKRKVARAARKVKRLKRKGTRAEYRKAKRLSKRLKGARQDARQARKKLKRCERSQA